MAARLFHKQRAVCYLLASFIGSSLLSLSLPWVAGPTKYVLLLAVLLFFLLPFAVVFLCRNAYIKSAEVSFTSHGLCVEATDEHYQVAWADLVAYRVQFVLGKLVGDGYRLTLREAQGHSVVLNLLEHQLVTSTDGVRADSALAYLCRYIGWHNQQAEEERIVLQPGLLARKAGVVLLAGLGVLVLVDIGIQVLRPASKGTSLGVLAGAVALGLQVLGQKKINDRYSHYLQDFQAAGGVAYGTGSSPPEGAL